MAWVAVAWRSDPRPKLLPPSALRLASSSPRSRREEASIAPRRSAAKKPSRHAKKRHPQSQKSSLPSSLQSVRRQSRFFSYLSDSHTSSDLRSAEQAIRFGWSQGSPSIARESSQSTFRASRCTRQPSGPRHEEAATSLAPSQASIVLRSTAHAYVPFFSHGSPCSPSVVSQRRLRPSTISHRSGPRQSRHSANRPFLQTRAAVRSLVHA